MVDRGRGMASCSTAGPVVRYREQRMAAKYANGVCSTQKIISKLREIYRTEMPPTFSSLRDINVCT